MFSVFIPSYDRCGLVKTIKYFDDPFIVVRNEELEDYKKLYNNVIGCNEIGITKTRNFILRYCKENNIRYHIQVDDDINGFWFMERGIIIDIESKEKIKEILTNMFIICEEWESKIFGLSMQKDKKVYREYSPFSTQSVVVANLMGIIDNDLYFDENCVVKEDYDYSIQHIIKYKRVIKCLKYGVDAPHLMNKGGCASYRTMQLEYDMLKYLQDKYGTKYIRDSGNKNVIRVEGLRKGI
jgi:hypothetical protein